MLCSQGDLPAAQLRELKCNVYVSFGFCQRDSPCCLKAGPQLRCAQASCCALGNLACAFFAQPLTEYLAYLE